MDVNKAIEERRAYRSLLPVEITDDLMDDLARNAQLSPSCFNKQPWKFVFVNGEEELEALHGALPEGNAWAKDGSLIIAAAAKKEDDCLIKNREYFLFDTGMAVAFLMLRATELGLVAHPIAGYDEAKVKELLDVPDDVTVITLIIVGKHADTISPVLSEDQAAAEKQRPPRFPLSDFAFKTRYGD
ncbi:MAG: nitroreductase [bacterium]|nr:nitroreductase [bacterium]